MLNIGASCLSDYPYQIDHPKQEIEFPTDRRLFALYQYFIQGGTVEEAHTLSRIDFWFLQHVFNIAEIEKRIKTEILTDELLHTAKYLVFLIVLLFVSE